uniref:Nudix hydrolase domain-containing protein n=1 Tax=Chlamydomonas euryale TaxID=1486919 RepID=A0A7R9VTY5_9CHLO|mmetsp:Transcript_44775/g.133739  ORF Transcript_44775/g.133739 Transcript_44775/m.133739 type:complete len:154 (+) Transcript_44775:254-715(+)
MASAKLPAPLVGVGVLLWRRNSGTLLVGKRLGSHGAGTYALPGGHLEYGESFEECAAREVAEETGIALALDSLTLAYTTSTVFPEVQRHYVTVFMQATVDEAAEARTMEPHKCEGWSWVPWGGIPQPVFPALASLMSAPGYSPEPSRALGRDS